MRILFLTDNFPPVEIKLKGEIEDLLLMNAALEVEDHIKTILRKSFFTEKCQTKYEKNILNYEKIF